MESGKSSGEEPVCCGVLEMKSMRFWTASCT